MCFKWSQCHKSPNPCRCPGGRKAPSLQRAAEPIQRWLSKGVNINFQWKQKDGGSSGEIQIGTVERCCTPSNLFLSKLENLWKNDSHTVKKMKSFLNFTVSLYNSAFAALHKRDPKTWHIQAAFFWRIGHIGPIFLFVRSQQWPWVAKGLRMSKRWLLAHWCKPTLKVKSKRKPRSL